MPADRSSQPTPTTPSRRRSIYPVTNSPQFLRESRRALQEHEASTQVMRVATTPSKPSTSTMKSPPKRSASTVKSPMKPLKMDTLMRIDKMLKQLDELERDLQEVKQEDIEKAKEKKKSKSNTGGKK